MTSIDGLIAAVQAVNEVIKNPAATQADLDKAAEREQETLTAYLQETHAQAQAEREAQMEAG